MSACLAIIGGVAALALLSGGISGGGTATTVVIPQQVGEGTNVVAVSAPQPQPMGFAGPQQGFGPPPQSFGPPPQGFGPPQQNFGPPQHNFGPPQHNFGAPQPYAPQGYGAPQQAAPYGDTGVGANIGMNGQSALGAGVYSGPEGAGIGANVGGIDASVGMGSRSY